MTTFLPLTNRIFKVATLATALLALSAESALANQITISGGSGYRNGPGGEFNVVAADAGGKTLLEANVSSDYLVNGANGTRRGVGFEGLLGIQTFCLEYNEYISLGGTYDVATSDFAKGGGGEAVNGADHISVGTEYLYTLFATGQLGGYTYTSGQARADSASALQNAFWFLEGERTAGNIGWNGTSGNVFLEFLRTSGFKGGLEANWKKDDLLDEYDAHVLNLTSDNGTKPHQDQLYLGGSRGRTVSDGGLTLMMLGAGLSGLAVLRRKLR